MPEQGHGSGGWKPHSTGIVEALIATAVGSSLLPAVTLGWRHFFQGEPPEWAKGFFPNLVAALILSPVFILLTVLGNRWRNRHRHKTLSARGDRLAIYVAHFGEDELARTMRESVIDSLVKELGHDSVEVRPAGVEFKLARELTPDEAAEKVAPKAQAFLRKWHGDLLIWGRVITAPGERACIEIRFVSASGGTEGSRFNFGDKFLLEPGFRTEIGTALAAMVLAQAAPARDTGRYVAEKLVPIEGRLAKIASHLPDSMPSNDRGIILNSHGGIQFAIGLQSGSNPRLESSAKSFRAALEEYTRERVPLDWAAMQHNLGAALDTLGERESGTKRLEEAVTAYRAALEERTRDRVPLDWAATQNNLGNTLSRLGERESGTKRLEEAVTAYRAALEEYTRERVPLDWAMTQNNLGNALRALGERESGTKRLEEAVTACRAALEERIRECVPLSWAMTQNNLGSALTALGERESGTKHLEEAVTAYRAALEEYTRQRVPLDWAGTQNNLGNVLKTLGEREPGTEPLEEAVTAYRAALEEYTRERAPLDWAMTQNNLGNALTALGERESGTKRLEEAVTAYRAALEERTREGVPLAWAATQNNLGAALRMLGERESGAKRLEEAVAAYRAALEERTRERVPLAWAATQSNLGNALTALGERESGTKRLEEAVTAFERAREVYLEAGMGHLCSNFESRLKEINELILARHSQGN
jgi:tetratricopeptide (TPR) repeat protein